MHNHAVLARAICTLPIVQLLYEWVSFVVYPSVGVVCCGCAAVLQFAVQFSTLFLHSTGLLL
jgi:hypothetical protein